MPECWRSTDATAALLRQRAPAALRRRHNEPRHGYKNLHMPVRQIAARRGMRRPTSHALPRRRSRAKTTHC